MTDFVNAVEKVLFDRLKTTISGVPIFQHVPEDQDPPVVILGDVTFEDEGEKDAPLYRFEIQVLCVVKGPGRKPLNALQAQVRDALDRWRPGATSAVTFGEVRIASASGQEIQGAQGPIYYGQQSANLYVQAA